MGLTRRVADELAKSVLARFARSTLQRTAKHQTFSKKDLKKLQPSSDTRDDLLRPLTTRKRGIATVYLLL